jgi:Transposase IS66 family
LRARFDRIFLRRTGFVTLDRLLKRLHANKAELLVVLDRPQTPLHTNGSENDIRCYVTRRKVSAGTRSDVGRNCRDGLLGLAKTCDKLGIAVWAKLVKVPSAQPMEYQMRAIWAADSRWRPTSSRSTVMSEAGSGLPDRRRCPRFCPYYPSRHVMTRPPETFWRRFTWSPRSVGSIDDRPQFSTPNAATPFR